MVMETPTSLGLTRGSSLTLKYIFIVDYFQLSPALYDPMGIILPRLNIFQFSKSLPTGVLNVRPQLGPEYPSLTKAVDK